MGALHYDGLATFTFDDRTLTHLRTVILSKLNLQESFAFTWSEGDHQRSIWIHPSLALHFEFDEVTTPPINPAWVDALMALANAPAGLRVVAEPQQPTAK